ncbi:outer membrane protein assembly factor BamB family protein [Gimesia algae]|uniref:Outer membrane biogenesis protein BamB n=1 Tax=Gimesia algae TaxID=2527971 RepID=A0A517VAB9_9PLAN|nr:PQQ-binding-like beta-propeller repeat protein [Gimesia algae]QDT89952.1 outer membrane biogenesis protein BamB [Gimesia algae]
MRFICFFQVVVLLVVFGTNFSTCCAQQEDFSIGNIRAPTLHLGQDTKAIKWKRKVGDYCSDVLVGSKQVIIFGNNTLQQQVQNTKVPNGTAVACFDRKTSQLQWISSFKRVKFWPSDLPNTSIRTFSHLDDKQLTFISNRSTLVCFDVVGFKNGDDGKIIETRKPDPTKGDLLWEIDLKNELHVERRELIDTASRIGGVILHEGIYYVVTGHGADYTSEGTLAPVFMAVDANNGNIVWSKSDLKMGAASGHFAAPSMIKQLQRTLVVFPGGDCSVYAYDIDGMKLAWKLDCNNRNSTVEFKTGNQLRFFSPPTILGNTMLVTTAQSPELGGNQHSVAAYSLGENGEPKLKWRWDPSSFQGTYAPIVVNDRVAFVKDVSGSLFAINIDTGKTLWHFDSEDDQSSSSILSSVAVRSQDENRTFMPLNESLYVISQAGTPKCTLEINFPGSSSVLTTPRVDNDELFVVAGDALYCLSISELLKYETPKK